DYQLLTIDEMPEIVPIIVPSNRPPQGVGEVVLAPLAPAVAQALFNATGRRIDVMPFPAAAFQAAVMAAERSSSASRSAGSMTGRSTHRRLSRAWSRLTCA